MEPALVSTCCKLRCSKVMQLGLLKRSQFQILYSFIALPESFVETSVLFNVRTLSGITCG